MKKGDVKEKEKEGIHHFRSLNKDIRFRLEARDSKGSKKSKITRDRERDISEKIALGMAKVQPGTGEALYDARLFNQDRGMATGPFFLFPMTESFFRLWSGRQLQYL